MSINFRHKFSQTGFTLVEIMVVAPIVTLVIGIIVASIVILTGSSMAQLASDNLSFNIQNALSTIKRDIKTTNRFLAINSVTLSSPSGYNNDTTAFKNTGVNGNMLILEGYATTGNPDETTASPIYLHNSPSLLACSNSSLGLNSMLTTNIVYFVKNNTLWRRVLLQPNYLSVICKTPWQQPSCAKGYSGNMCTTEDSELINGISAFILEYYTNQDQKNPIAAATNSGLIDATRQVALDTATSVKISISATSTVSNRSVVKSGSLTVRLP